MSEAEIAEAAQALVLGVAAEMGERAGQLTGLLHERLIDEIEVLRGDPVLRDLLAASIESNLVMLVRIIQFKMPMPEGTAPPAAAEYARRLAQRGTDPSALLRAYRLGQESALLWALDRIAELAADREVALLAGRSFVQMAFRYVDAISVQVLAEYEDERVRWLANSNSVRAATLAELLGGQVPEVGAAESALGYRLRQHHVAVVLWLDHEGSPDGLRALEHLLVPLGTAFGASGRALFVPQDRSTGWAWLPLGRHAGRPGPTDEQLLAELDAVGARVAVGGTGAGFEGFRSTHIEARRAQELALMTHDPGRRFTSWFESDVRAASLMLSDMEATRRLVASTLGQLADDTESTARLRQTVGALLQQNGSYTGTAAALTVHKNTVRYRVEKAVELRGRTLEEDRLDLELALIACDWFGPAVLTS